MKRIIPVLPWLGDLLLIALALLCFESDLLWKVQQYNIFLDTPLFFREQMVVPGGLLSYVGCFFTQFFFYPWLGVLMLCGWWLLLMWLTKRTFRIDDNWSVLALIPIAILLVADMSLGYWHYFMKLRGYFFVPTIGTTVGVALLWAFRSLPRRLWLRIVCVVLVLVAGYPLIGAYALATALLMAVWSWRLERSLSWNAVLSLVVLLGIVAVPMLYYRHVYYQTNLADLWHAALPTFNVVGEYPVYFTPYYLLGCYFLLMAIGSQASPSAKWLKKPVFRWSLQSVLAAVLVAGVWQFWYKDKNFHHELAIQHCIEQTDWEGVLSECGKLDEEPTQFISLARKLALTRLGRLLDEIYNFPIVHKKCNTPLPVDMLYHIGARMLYYQYGLLNDSHRICIEDGVEYGWRVEVLEYMARCSLLSGETQAARKALNLLRHTMFHSRWADAMQPLVDHPEQIAEARETGPVSHMLHYSNAVGGDGGYIERYVMSLLASQDSDDPYFQELAVLGAMWMRDPALFRARFTHYARLHPHDNMPRLFQEAAYLMGKMENNPNIDRLPFDKGVKDTYNAFMQEAVKYDNQNAELGRSALYPFFGNTYYFYYFFMKM